MGMARRTTVGIVPVVLIRLRGNRQLTRPVPHSATVTALSKDCARCGRRFSWRKRWARNWDEVRFCSKRCAGKPIDATDRALERAILEIAQARGRRKSLCPSEAARAVAGDEDWRWLMKRTMDAARRLCLSGDIEILQRGRRVDPTTASGPVRLRRR